MIGICIFIVLFCFVLLFRAAALLRLSMPLLYALVVPTIFHNWYYANTELATGIWYAMLALVAVSWTVSLIQRIRS